MDGLVGYWPLDGLEATDDSGNGLDGFVNGEVEATEDRFGDAEGAMLFPGRADSHVDLGDEPDFQITGAMTLAAWVLFDSNNTTNNGRIVAKQAGGGSRSWSLNIESAGTPATFQISPDGDTILSVGDLDPLPMDQWTHITGVFRPGASTEVYVNGELKELEDVDIPDQQFSDNGQPVLIGARNACGNCGWPGAIDDVAIWNRDLSSQEVQELFTSGIGGGTLLLPGDADMDLDFDQLDLVKVQVAAKYLTGQPATWGEGDWDGAPGGEPGNPPTGNGQFDQLDIIAALAPGHYLTGLYAAVQTGGGTADNQTSVGYDVNMSVVGSLAGGGDLGAVDLIYVPEPTGLWLALTGLLALVARAAGRQPRDAR